MALVLGRYVEGRDRWRLLEVRNENGEMDLNDVLLGEAWVAGGGAFIRWCTPYRISDYSSKVTGRGAAAAGTLCSVLRQLTP